MADKEKKTKKFTYKKALIRNSVMGGLCLVGGAVAIGLSTNFLFTLLGVVTLGLTSVWTVGIVKAIKAIKQKKQGYALDGDSRLVHSSKYKQATKERQIEIDRAKEEYARKKSKIKENADSELGQKREIRLAKKEEKKALKGIPKKSKGYKVATGFAVVAAGLTILATGACGFFFAKEFESAGAHANESNTNQDQYLQVENVKNLSLGITLAAVNVANTVFATSAAVRLARKREDDLIDYEASQLSISSQTSDLPTSYVFSDSSDVEHRM